MKMDYANIFLTSTPIVAFVSGDSFERRMQCQPVDYVENSNS